MPSLSKQMQTAIQAQWEAFQKNDYEKAYGYAAEGIRQIFTPSAFESMVRTRYPLIAQSKRVDFGITIENGDEGVVYATFTGSEDAATYQYSLQKDPKGWRITGVQEADGSQN